MRYSMDGEKERSMVDNNNKRSRKCPQMETGNIAI